MGQEKSLPIHDQHRRIFQEVQPVQDQHGLRLCQCRPRSLTTGARATWAPLPLNSAPRYSPRRRIKSRSQDEAAAIPAGKTDAYVACLIERGPSCRQRPGNPTRGIGAMLPALYENNWDSLRRCTYQYKGHLALR
jgi:hypothetical protein